jgi:hypothetical protein
MDVMESEAAKYKFEREKNKYSCSEHLERFRQIQISRGMDPTHAVPLAKKKNRSASESSGDSSSNSSGSSLSSSAVGTDSSNKKKVPHLPSLVGVVCPWLLLARTSQTKLLWLNCSSW